MSDEGTTTIHLAPTIALVIRLALRLRRIHSTRIFCFLDNLFLNVDVAQALLALQICCTDTTCKNVQGISSWLIKIKEHTEDLFGITTAHRLKDETIERLRKRPSPMSTNARVLRPIFGDLPAKRLRIPCVIDDYKHFMNGEDTANQLRHNFKVHRSFERRIWRPLWYYILDVCAVNGYLL